MTTRYVTRHDLFCAIREHGMAAGLRDDDELIGNIARRLWLAGVRDSDALPDLLPLFAAELEADAA
jgi:hypothetical protein